MFKGQGCKKKKKGGSTGGAPYFITFNLPQTATPPTSIHDFHNQTKLLAEITIKLLILNEKLLNIFNFRTHYRIVSYFHFKTQKKTS